MSRVRRPGRLLGAWLAAGGAAAALIAVAAPTPPAPGWVEVDYGALVDRRQPTHSGESVGEILKRLEGRAVGSPTGPLTADRVAHGNLDPFLETYAFVLPDALDGLGPIHDPPLAEVGWLWSPGEAQPGWAELLRARRYLVESDGRGYLRVFVPATVRGATEPDARAAWTRAWPVLRHVLAAERRRLAGGGGRAAPPVTVDVHVYEALPELTKFKVATRALRFDVADTRSDGLRPPLDLEGLAAFLASGLRLEGARLDAGGTLHLLGSQAGAPPTLLGRPLAPSDLAVAYRAVFDGGLAEPYMSLDRGFGPHASVVNYGGRLRDTSLGWVSLLCDIRFKTFSLGLDIVTGDDLRQKIRAALPEFRTHLERLAADPGGKGTASQQTRLWFYPDQVDLTIAPEGDVLVLRRVRMSAASERVADGQSAGQRSEDPPWTRDTVLAVNRDYDALARLFPELADLDQVVRLLALFTWLRQAAADGLLVPTLDDLLAIELPASYTPRTYPQLLAFNAVPPAGSAGAVVTLDRVPVAEALGRLNPASPPLPARERFERAMASLDPKQPDQAALLAELRGAAPERLDESALDQLAYRAQRLAMHHRVLTTLDREHRQELAGRFERGEQLRVFSVAIGGLDLGMEKVLERAQGRRVDPAARPGAGATERTPQDAWRAEPAGLPAVTLPDHGLARKADKSAARRDLERRWFAVESGPSAGGRTVRTILGVNGPEVRSRTIDVDRDDRATLFERVENMRLLRYRMEREGGTLVARSVPPSPVAPETVVPSGPLPTGLVVLEVVPPPGAGRTAGVTLRLSQASGDTGRRSIEAEFPRPVLERLVSGPAADATPGQPLPGLSPLPAALAAARTIMVVPAASQWLAPWSQAAQPLLGEEDPLTLARALRDWWGAAGQGTSAVVGVDPIRSPARWAAAPAVNQERLLLLPEGGFQGVWAGFDARLRQAWGGKTASDLGSGFAGSLVVVISAEPPGSFAERLRALARHKALEGKHLAGLCLAGPLRTDLPGAILAEARLGGLGLGESSEVSARGIVQSIEALAQGLGGGTSSPERLPGPFLWFY